MLQVPVEAVIGEKAVPKGPVVVMNLWDRRQELSLQAISQMTVTTFAQLWTVSLRHGLYDEHCRVACLDACDEAICTCISSRQL